MIAQTIDVNGQQVQYFGWVPPESRTASETAANTTVMASMPSFQLSGSFKSDRRKVGLYEFVQKITGSKGGRYINQSSGSCIGAGGANALYTLIATEKLQGNKMCEFLPLWWLYTYGESREIAGMRGRGDGSTGAGWAKAITTKGIFAAEQEGLPKFEMRNGWYYLSPSIEREWSDGQQSPAKWDAIAKDHLVKSAAQCRSASDVATAIQNGYPCTVACMFGTRGQKRLGDGENAVMVSEWDGSWAHQQFIDAWWDHPMLGELFRIGNNWGPDAHSPAADGSPNGGYWVRKNVVDRMCQSEVFALSAFNHFLARELDWGSIWKQAV